MNIKIKRLKEALKKSGLSQTDVCNKTGINKGALSSYLSGRYFPKQKTLYLLSKTLCVSIPYLMGWEEESTQTNNINKSIRNNEEINLINKYQSLDYMAKKSLIIY